MYITLLFVWCYSKWILTWGWGSDLLAVSAVDVPYRFRIGGTMHQIVGWRRLTIRAEVV